MSTNDDIDVHFACVSKKPGLRSVKTKTDSARQRLSSIALSGQCPRRDESARSGKPHALRRT
ncbi:hypothetical protein EMIT0P291_320049 [Pseudomonas sp. IT-P291]